MRCAIRLAAAALLAMLCGSPALGADGVTAPEAASAAPPIRIIVEIPNDDAGRTFVKDRFAPPPPAAASAVAPSPPVVASDPVADEMAPADRNAMPAMMATRIETLRARALALLAAAPSVPAEIEAALERFGGGWTRFDLLWLLVASALFIGGGFLAQRFAFWSARGLMSFILTAPAQTVGQRLKLHAIRISIGLLLLSAFLIGSLGAFLLFPWPPVFRQIVLVLLAATIAVRLAVTFGRVIIAPGARFQYFRVLPLETPLAWFWFRWLLGLSYVAAAGWAVINLLRIVGVSEIGRAVVQGVWLAVLAILVLVMIWRRHARPEMPQLSRLTALVLSVAVVVGWLFAVTQMPALLSTMLIATILPLMMKLAQDAVRNVAQVDDPSVASDSATVGWVVVVERALRVVLVVGAAMLLAQAWDIDLGMIAMGESAITRTIRAALRIVIVLLVADVIWKLVRTFVESRTAPVTPGAMPGHDDSREAGRRQRLNTLLPILRNFLMVLIAAVTVLMILDAIGVQIGPLLAGAGVVGIAVGFGAQTLVKDIISGIFYLLDDAFRVGEYIQTASHKGTVESFSLRSIKLRHHRGPITTVPFGDLGAVQNLSRDWVIDKITVGVPYDTDLDQVRKIVKQIGRELMADEELAPNIIEPLKMQGVEMMGDYDVKIRMKVMTKPGEQFAVRRKTYSLLKKAFEANGIRFGTPTVTVSSGSAMDGAAAATAGRISASKDIPLSEPA